jgi:L-iditol 2-dehydrogenase
VIAVDLVGPRQFQLMDECAPRIGPTDVLLRIYAVGVCGSDIAVYAGSPYKVLEYPVRLGHEFSGEVVASGSTSLRDARGRRLAESTVVAVDPNQPCLVCEMCAAGRQNLCLEANSSPLKGGGALAEYVRVPARSCFSVAPSVDALQAALVEPLAVALHVIDRSALRIGHDVAIFGAGPLGTLVARLAAMYGASRVFAFDLFEWRLQPLRVLGIDAVRIGTCDPASYIATQTNNRGVDIAIEAAWMNESAQQAVASCKVGGRVLLAGIPRSRDAVEISCSTARRKGLALEFIRRTNSAFARALTMIEDGKIGVRDLVSHVFPLDRVVEAFELNSRYAEGVRKVLINLRTSS